MFLSPKHLFVVALRPRGGLPEVELAELGIAIS